MARSLDELTTDAMDLSASERAELAKRLTESLEFFETEEIARAWAVESERRLAEWRAGRVEAIPGEQVFEEIRGLLRG